MVELGKGPFYLNEEQQKWVENTLAGMSEREKAGQLFCVLYKTAEPQDIDYVYEILEPGACMYRSMPVKSAVEVTKRLRKRAKIPLLIAANLEKGGNGILQEGTVFGSPMEAAATGDPKMAENLAVVCAREAKAVGANWAFAPIIDIDGNYHNPITNTRTFGSDPEVVLKMGLAYMKAVQEEGLAASIKHFPGDGQDERDQHLVTSINDLSCEEWEKTYGKVYKSCIEEGALTCMVGHIMQPAWSRRLNPDLKEEEILPGSLSKELMTGLLREKLGFNGLIVTDATTMAGFTIPMSRKRAVPQTIAAGADMFLFSRNLEEDFHYMLQGIHDGIISKERLDDAVRRILAVKAALLLHQPQKELDAVQAEKIVGCEEHKRWARECADRAITLVKEEPGVLPLSTKKYPRILFYPLESSGGVSQYQVEAGVCEALRQRLIKEGFLVDVFSASEATEGKTPTMASVIEHYDFILYVANLATKSNQTTVRIEWAQPMGANCAHYQNDVPTVFLSVENPYHLLDVPRIKTFINCYNSNTAVLDMVVEKLMGRSSFKGKSPIDPFCGKWDAHL